MKKTAKKYLPNGLSPRASFFTCTPWPQHFDPCNHSTNAILSHTPNNSQLLQVTIHDNVPKRGDLVIRVKISSLFFQLK